MLVFIPILGWIILFYWMGIKKGDDSSNRFGEPSNIIASGIDILLLIGILILSISVNVVSKDPLINPKQIEQHLSVDN